VARGAVVGLGGCVVALLLFADALDVGVVVAIGAAGTALCWLVGVVRPVAGGLIESLLGLVGLMLGAGVGGWHVVRTGVTATGVVGLVALVFGLVLLSLGVWQLSRGVRGWWWLLALPTAFLVFQFVLVPITPTLAAVDPPRSPMGSATPVTYGLPYSDVEFRTGDGVTLSGWYLPSRNGAAVAVLHGSGSTRTEVLPQAVAVASRGYGVLLYDDRGQGRSDGTAMDFGWWGDSDLAAAVTWLQQQPGADPARIGAVGISMGGEQAINLAATDPRIRTVVAEGVQARQPADLVPEPGPHGWTVQTVMALSTGTAALLSGAPVPIPLQDAVRRIAPRPVLVIAAGDEIAVVQRMQAAAPSTVQVWALPRSTHAQGFADQPDEWTSRVGGILDSALRKPPTE
jgi:pimeloyl-ACP methyl ester carboxylesterase